MSLAGLLGDMTRHLAGLLAQVVFDQLELLVDQVVQLHCHPVQGVLDGLQCQGEDR